jgi:coproporphyrinogen III oxidase
MIHLEEIIAFFKSLQDDICAGLEQLDGSGTSFVEDLWERPGGGGGRTRVFTDGGLVEKGGVNFSHVHGKMPEKISNRLNLPSGTDFHATGVSIVLHSSHPFVPIIHMNVRYFQTDGGNYWFGGGIDVTPAYIDREQAIQFHRELKAVCDAHDADYYPRFKKWCDEYFFLPHRNETRGIGGIFFDHLKGADASEKAALFAFVQDVGRFFVPAYTQLAEANRNRDFGPAHRDWQFYRRGRYVEFNLLWDKGTKFGVDTGGRTESILMSLPPTANWAYMHRPEAGSDEASTLELLRPINWLGIEADTPAAPS